MTRSHEQDHDRDHDDLPRRSQTGAAPGRTTRTQNMVGPNGPMPSGILMRKARDGSGVQDGADNDVARAASSSGQALPADLRSKFEGSLGTDLSDVRVHTGSSSAAAADAVGARAYALGNDIHFGSGQFDPASSSGQHLLAHEVAHTVQQRGGSPQRQNKLAVSSGGDAAELEADRAADAMTSRSSFSLSGASNGIARKEAEAGDEKKKPEKLKLPKWTDETTSIPLGVGTDKFGTMKLNWKDGSAAYSKTAGEEMELFKSSESFQSEIAPLVVVDTHYKVSGGVGANVNIGASGAWVDTPGPRIEEEKSLQVQASGGGSVEAFVKGSLGIGAGLGMANVVNVVADVEAGLEAKASIGCTMSGTITRDPEGTINGELRFTVDGGITLQADAALNIDFVYADQRATLYTVDLARATIGKVSLTGGTSYKNGEITPVGDGKPKVVWLPLPPGEKREKRKLTEKEKQAYFPVDQGASGAGPAGAPDTVEMTDEELFQAGLQQAHSRMDRYKGDIVSVTDDNSGGIHHVSLQLGGRTFTQVLKVDPDPIYAPPEDQRQCKKIVAVLIQDIHYMATRDQVKGAATANSAEDKILKTVDLVLKPAVADWDPSPSEAKRAEDKQQHEQDRRASEQANQSCDEVRDDLAPTATPQSVKADPAPSDPFAPEPQSIE